jgi:adenosylcobinamide-phosphate synthase
VVTAAVAAGVVADWLLGEPPARWHPVAGFGQAMTWLEQRSYADSQVRGVAYAALGTGLAAGAGVGLDRLARALGATLGPSLGRSAIPAAEMAADRLGAFASLALATYVTVAGRALGAAASDVAAALQAGDLEAARRHVPVLVGRDPNELGPGEIARAVVESVAENTVDAIVAPVFWAGAGGPAAVLAYRAINTLDAMVGHPTPRHARFGWGSAKADDVAAWLPARLTAVLVAAVRPGRAAAVWRAVRRQAGAHPSPNAGVAEAAFAAALGVRLGGVNLYEGRLERRPPLGWGPPPTTADIARAVRLSRHVSAVLVLAGLARPAWRWCR